jgi:hypothetical protein
MALASTAPAVGKNRNPQVRFVFVNAGITAIFCYGTDTLKGPKVGTRQLGIRCTRHSGARAEFQSAMESGVYLPERIRVVIL